MFGLLLLVLILAGIHQGWFTPTEAAAFAAVHGFLIAMVIYLGIGLLKSNRRPDTRSLLMRTLLSGQDAIASSSAGNPVGSPSMLCWLNSRR